MTRCSQEILFSNYLGETFPSSCPDPSTALSACTCLLRLATRACRGPQVHHHSCDWLVLIPAPSPLLVSSHCSGTIILLLSWRPQVQVLPPAFSSSLGETILFLSSLCESIPCADPLGLGPVGGLGRRSKGLLTGRVLGPSSLYRLWGKANLLVEPSGLHVLHMVVFDLAEEPDPLFSPLDFQWGC